jgi:hypothetical protein
MYKTYSELGNKLQKDAPTVFNNVLLTFTLDKVPACFVVGYDDNGKRQSASVCGFHIVTTEEQVLVTAHYITRDKKSSHKVKQVAYKLEGENIYSFGQANNFSSRIISFAYSLQTLLNRYTIDLDLEPIKDEEELSVLINDYFQDYVKDDIAKIEKSKEDMDLSDAVSFLSLD